MALGLEFYSDSHEHLKRKRPTKPLHAQKSGNTDKLDYLFYCVLSLNLNWNFWMKTH